MKQKTAGIISLSILIIFFFTVFSWPAPVSAGISEWSAETIPGKTDNVLGPDGAGDNIDICDYAIGDDNTTIYAVTGNSTTGNVVYKSTNAGAGWTALPVSIRADLVAVAPNNVNIVAIANKSTPEVQLSTNGGGTWYTLGTPANAAFITDIAISDVNNGKNYIAAAGREAGNIANLWYYAYGEAVPAWQGTKGLAGFTSANEVAAIAFSPGFSSDTTLAAVTYNASVSVQLQLFSLGGLKWNDAATFTGYPCTVTSQPGMTGLTSASLSLSPSYDGSDDDYRNLFIGLTIAGNATAAAASGIYRFRDTVKADILLDKQIHSVAFNGTYLIAGLYNDTTVYRVQNPLASSWTVKASTTTKNPGGDNRVRVAWMGSSVTAGTAGNESAFSISKDSGTTFNDISLIDTEMTSARDVAVSASGAKVYYVTDDGTDTSLWYKSSTGWSRVLSLKNATDFIVRTERQNANIVYLAQKNTTTIYYNSSSGTAQWHARIIETSVADIAVESTQVVYFLGINGKVAKSINNGQIWSAAIDTTLTSGGMLYSISTGNLLAGSHNGYVAYSLDGNTSWKQVPQAFNPGAGKIHVIPDRNFATNKTIYAASESTGQNIMKWQIDISTSWTDIFSGTITGGVYGLAIDSNTLYALEFNGATGQSTLWRFIAPVNATSTSTDWIGIPTTATTDINDNEVHLNATPQALKTSTGKLWAVKTNGVKKLYSFSDSVTDITITLEKPEDDFSARVNAFTGFSEDVGFTWQRPSVATEYEIRISLDTDFYSVVASVIVSSSEEIVFVLIGPRQAGARRVDFMPGMTYYWKIRTTKPGYSLYSGSRSFTIEPVLATGVELLAPANGGRIESATPAFSWQPISGAMEYEFMLSDDISMSSPLLDAKIEGAGIRLVNKLEYGKTYFWRVRATSPAESEWSIVANFMIAEPVPDATAADPTPVVIEIPGPSHTEVIFPPAESPTTVRPGYLIFAIFILVVLVAAVILLIFIRQPGRIFSFIHVPDDLGHIRRHKETTKQPVPPREKPLTPAAATKTYEPTVDKTVSPAIPIKPVGPLEKPAGPAIQKPVKSGKDIAVSPPAEKNKEAEAVIFAAKSFMWLEEKETTGPADGKERDSLGKKLAAGVRGLAGKEPLHIKHPEDAAMLLRIWARFRSRNETGRYLAESFKSKPDNAIRLIKCYLPPDVPPETGDPAAFFTRDTYKAVAEVVDPEKVYAALTKVFKFKLDSIEETIPVKPADRNIAFKFMRLHLQEKA